MRQARPIALALVTLVAASLLHAGALSGWPEGARLALAFAVLVLLPGHALLRLTGAQPPGGAWLASGWALGFGVAWLGLLILLTRIAHLPFTVLTPWSAIPGAALWLLAARRERGVPDDAQHADAIELHPIAVAAVVAAAVLVALHCARLGTPVSYYTDSPDHIGSIRRMLAGGDAFPTDAFFLDAGARGADPRKGLWHPCVALIASLARVDLLPAWRMLAALLAPFFVLNAAAFAALLGGSVAAAVGAWALLLTYGGSLGTQYLREAVFATKLADQLALATAAAVLYDLRLRRAETRWAAVGLALGAVAAHVFSAIQFGICFGAFGVGLLVRDRGLRSDAKRLIVTCMALAAACLPYLAWRAMGAYAPTNIIHTEPQGLLSITDTLHIISFGVLWDWMGQAWILFPLSWWAYARAANRPAVLYLLTTSVAVALLIFTPWSVAVLSPRLGYLLMRFVWLLPLSAAVAFAVVEALRAWRAGGALRRTGALLTALVLALLLRHPVLDALFVLQQPRWVQQLDATVSVERWADALAWMDRALPARSVVLSDPATSYSVPMMTRHYVATLVDQHSSPNDSLALTRILDARDALDPSSSFERTRQVVQRYGITAIALNNRFHEPPRLDYWAPNPEWFRAARARLDRAPAAFQPVFDTGDFVVYSVHPGALDTLHGGARPRAYVRAYDPVRDPAPMPMGPALPGLVRCALSQPQAHLGDTLALQLEWRAPHRLPAGAYEVAVRFEHALPPGFKPPTWFAKPARKLLERRTGVRYRFRADHLPVDGDYGVDLWRPEEVVHDSVAVVIPTDVALGGYEVQVRMFRTPHYPNYDLRDYFLEHDYYSGTPVARLEIPGPESPPMIPDATIAMRPVRVAFFQAWLPFGGAERLVQSLVMRMDPTRITPLLLNLYAPGAVGEELIAAGYRSVDHLATSRFDLGVGRRLHAVLAAEAVDVTYVYDSALPMFWAGLERRRSPQPPLVLGFHSTGKLGDPLQHLLANRATLPVADRFVALADSHLDYLAKKLSLARDRFDVIGSGVDLETFSPPLDRAAVRRRLGLPEHAPLAGIVAALRPEKNHALFIAAAARVHQQLPEARFVIIGDGPERPTIEAAVAAHGLEDVVLRLGARHDIPELWRALDLAVLSSHPVVETLPVTLLEAHATGLPAVSTDVGSVRDIVVEGETGFLVPVGDATALAERMALLLADEPRRAAMGRAARVRAERRFGRDAMVRSYEDLFVRMAAGRPGGSQSR